VDDSKAQVPTHRHYCRLTLVGFIFINIPDIKIHILYGDFNIFNNACYTFIQFYNNSIYYLTHISFVAFKPIMFKLFLKGFIPHRAIAGQGGLFEGVGV